MATAMTAVDMRGQSRESLFGPPPAANGPRRIAGNHLPSLSALTSAAAYVARPPPSSTLHGPPAVPKAPSSSRGGGGGGGKRGKRLPQNTMQEEEAVDMHLADSVLRHEQDLRHVQGSATLQGEQNVLRRARADLLGSLYSSSASSGTSISVLAGGGGAAAAVAVSTAAAAAVTDYGAKTSYISAVAQQYQDKIVAEAQWLALPPFLKWMFKEAKDEPCQLGLQQGSSTAQTRGARHLIGAISRHFSGNKQSDIVASLSQSRQFLLRAEEEFGPQLACAVGFTRHSGPLTRPDSVGGGGGGGGSKRARDGGVRQKQRPDHDVVAHFTHWRGGAFLRLPASAANSNDERQHHQIVLDSVWTGGEDLANSGLVPYLVHVMVHLADAFHVSVLLDDTLAPIYVWIELFERALAARHSHSHTLRLVSLLPSATRSSSSHTVVVPAASRPGLSIEPLIWTTTTTTTEQSSLSSSSSSVSPSASVEEKEKGVHSSVEEEGKSGGVLVVTTATNVALTRDEWLLQRLKGRGGLTRQTDALSSRLPWSAHVARLTSSSSGGGEVELLAARLSSLVDVPRTFGEAMVVFASCLQELGLPLHSVIPIPLDATIATSTTSPAAASSSIATKSL